MCEDHFTDQFDFSILPSHIASLLGDCFVLIEAVADIFKVMACFLAQVILAVANMITFGFGKLFVNTLYWILWIIFHFTCGILGLEDKSTSAFSWLFLVLVVFLYCDRTHNELFVKVLRVVSAYTPRRHGRMGFFNRNIHYNEIVLENQRNEHREIEPINRQREIENRENENEENDLVEADRHRIDNDNRRNIARENGADNHRASIENRQNVERERHNTRTYLENRRNRTQEQHRYFLRQRHRNRQPHGDQPRNPWHGAAGGVSGQSVTNVLQPNGQVSLTRTHRGVINC